MRWAAPFLAAMAIAAVPARAQTPASPAATQDQSTQQATLSEAQLQQLVAPIALYPDNLLSQVLMASTYPLEVVEAERWAKANPTVTGAALQTALEKQSWDPSVKALVAVPQTLQMMSDKLDWTQQLGDAFLAQQQDVLDAVQKLRARADAAGNLKTGPQQTVTRSSPPAGVSPPAGLQQVISIEPTSPDNYYVPIYNPEVVYGAWPWPDYQPFYWYPAGWATGTVFGFAGAAVVGGAIWGTVNWWRRSVGINVDRYNRFNRTHITNNVWNHNPRHRGNVPYHNAAVARRFHQADRNAQRDQFRREGINGNREGRDRTGNRGADNLRHNGAAGRHNVNRQAGGRSDSHRRVDRGGGGQRRVHAGGGGGGERRAVRSGGGGARRAVHSGGGGGHRAFGGGGGGARHAFGGGGRRGGGGGGGRGRRR